MFPGNNEKVKIRFKNHLINAVLDRLGLDVNIIKDSEDNFCDEAKVVLTESLLNRIIDKIEKMYLQYNEMSQ